MPGIHQGTQGGMYTGTQGGMYTGYTQGGIHREVYTRKGYP